MEPLNPPSTIELIPALPPQKNKKTTVIILSSISLVFLLVSIFLFVRLEQTKAQMQSEIESTKSQAQQDIQVMKKASDAEIQSLKNDIEKLKTSTLQPDLSKLDTWSETNWVATNNSPFSRDTTRIGNSKDITMALWAYFSDRETYPETESDGCITEKSLNQNYLPKGVPVDPVVDHINEWCQKPGYYAYRWFPGSTGYQNYAVSATFEDDTAGNSAKSLSDYTDDEIKNGIFSYLKKWSGKYYILTN